MAESALITSRSRFTPILASVTGLVVVFFVAMWLRVVPLESDPVLQGYLQVITGLLAFVFAAVTLVRFQGTQDRISLILGVGFMVTGLVLTATSVLFFQLRDARLEFLWAPVAWWESRMVFALLLIVALLVERFLPRSLHPRRELAGALVAVISASYLITATLRRLPPEGSPHPFALFPSPQQLLPGAIFLARVIWYRRRLTKDARAFDRAIYATAALNLAAQCAEIGRA